MSPDYQQTLKDVLKMVLEPLVDQFTMDIVKESDQWRIILETDKKDVLLQDGAEILKSVQYLVRVIVHKKYPTDRTHFLIDVGKYRLEREIAIKAKINQLARTEVLEKGTTCILVGLTGYERKLVHNMLREVNGLETTSVGYEPSRKLIIRPTTETGSTGMDNAKIIDLFADKLKDTKTTEQIESVTE
jgi:spoIIIJ-associated protein